MHSAKKKVLTRLSNEPVPSTMAIFLDGKKFSTKTQEKVGDLFNHSYNENADHYVVTDAVRQSYLGDFVPECGTGEAIADGLLEFIEEKDGIEISDVTILGGDSTNVNTGPKGGVFAHVEKKTNLSFHRFICLLHLIELLLRAIVGHFVGVTSGPTSFASALGKQITTLKDPVISTFKKIPCPHFPSIPSDVLAVSCTFIREGKKVQLTESEGNVSGARGDMKFHISDFDFAMGFLYDMVIYVKQGHVGQRCV